MSSTNVSGTLGGVELFQGLTRQELERLERLAHPRHYEPGNVIIHEGQGGIAFFILTSGQAVVTRTGSDGQQREMRKVGPGGVFGEMALFTDRPRSATITALEPTDCLALHRLEFLEELRRNPEVAIRLLDTLAARLSEAYDQQ
ncbi:MAG TPA: cyclic nucleotide-binding domain-containing protein [Chloroflexota bacterium]|nr:cyclic nucleotide-binding domain-containing protein [Chloroflexota bacterium]